MNAPASITITPVHVADLLAEGERMPVYVHVIDHPEARVLVDTGMTELHPAVADMDPRLFPLSEQTFDLAAMDRFHDFDGRVAGLRDFLRSDAPHFRCMRPCFRVGDGPLAGKLVTLLAVLPSALAIALPCDHRATSAFAADVPSG